MKVRPSIELGWATIYLEDGAIIVTTGVREPATVSSSLHPSTERTPKAKGTHIIIQK